MARGMYSFVGGAQAVSTAITIVEITAATNTFLVVKRAWIICTTPAVAGAMNRAQLLRKTATITGGGSPPTPRAIDGTQASGVTAKWLATAEGTDGNIEFEDGFNTQSNGWLFLPKPEEEVKVVGAGIIAIKFPAAPTSANYSFGIVWDEYA